MPGTWYWLPLDGQPSVSGSERETGPLRRAGLAQKSRGARGARGGRPVATPTSCPIPGFSRSPRPVNRMLCQFPPLRPRPPHRHLAKPQAPTRARAGGSRRLAWQVSGAGRSWARTVTARGGDTALRRWVPGALLHAGDRGRGGCGTCPPGASPFSCSCCCSASSSAEDRRKKR